MEWKYEIEVRLHNDQVVSQMVVITCAQDRPWVVKTLSFKLVSNAPIMKYLVVQAGRKFR